MESITRKQMDFLYIEFRTFFATVIAKKYNSEMVKRLLVS